MKKLFFILLLLKFLYSDWYATKELYNGKYNQYLTYFYHTNFSTPFNNQIDSNERSYLNQYAMVFDGYVYYDDYKFPYTDLFYYTDFYSKYNLNSSCINNNAILKSYQNVKYYYVPDSVIDFCSNKSGYTYSSVINAWVPNSDTNGSIICPAGKQWNSENEQCEEPPKDCNYYQNQCNIKCNGYVKSFHCSADNPSSSTCICKSCSDLHNDALSYCKSLNQELYYFTCIDKNGIIQSASTPLCIDNSNVGKLCITDSKTGKTTCSNLDLNYSDDSNNQLCVTDPDTNKTVCSNLDVNDSQNTLCVTNSDGKQICSVLKPLPNDQSNSSNQSSDNSSSSNQSSNNNSSSNQSSNNSSSSSQSSDNSSSSTQSSNNNCPDPCYLYTHKPLGFTTDLVSQNGISCYTVIQPVYDGCTLKYHLKDGKCFSGCSNDSGSNSNSNSDIGSVTSRLDNINNNIKKTNDLLESIKDLKPDNSLEKYIDANVTKEDSTLLSSLTETFDNLKSSIYDLNSSANQVIKLLKNPKHFTLFNNENIQTCPLSTIIYGQTISVDICKFVSPYRPILQLFFTLVFSFSVVLYFFDVFLRSRS